ncbi:MAG: N-acetyltransferase [Thermoplasmata archaeon]
MATFSKTGPMFRMWHSGGDMLSADHDDGKNRSSQIYQTGQRQQGPTIRPAIESDFESIMEIENSCFPGELAYSRQQMRYLLFQANSATLVEEAEGQVNGYVTALFRENSSVAGIETIGVSPGHRGRGTGRRLLSAAEEHMAERGKAVSRLEVSAGNHGAVAMYRKAGYEVTEALPGYYIHDHNGTRQAYRMEKPIRRQID